MNNKRNALGKGLGALLTSPETDITTRNSSPGDSSVVGSISELQVAQIEANPFHISSLQLLALINSESGRILKENTKIMIGEYL